MLSPRRQHRVTAIGHQTVLSIRMPPALRLTACLTLSLAVSAAADAATTPLGLPAIAEPPAEARVALGARLFFDPRLSVDGSRACSTCHLPEQAFTQNGIATPIGLDGQPLPRNAPTLLNVRYRQRLFHDGRESDLDRQAFAPLLAENEMGNPDTASLLTRLAAAADYPQAFAAAFADGISEANLGQALADFQRTLLSAGSAFDRWYYGGESDAMSSQAKAGFFVFSASGCGDCHRFGHRFAHFTDDALHRTGLTGADTGLAEVSGKAGDRHRFRTPTLRDVARTAPYMHDGRLASLMDVVDFYDRGGGPSSDDNESAAGKVSETALTPLGLSEGDKQSLVAFLESLTGGNPAIGLTDRQPPSARAARAAARR
jgi:cytochrome c peroxidase